MITPVLCQYGAANRADGEDMAAAFADGRIDSGAEALEDIEGHEGLDCACEAAAVDAVGAAAGKEDVAEGEGDVDCLFFDASFNSGILEIFVG